MHDSGFILNFIFDFMGKLGLWSVLIFMFAESALIPIPSEATMAMSGFLAGMGYFSLWSGILVGSMASIAGALLIYFIAYKKGETWVRGFIKKYGKYIFIHEEEYDKSKEWFTKYSQWIVIIARLTPVIRMFISLPAGVTKMNPLIYTLLVTIAAFVWSTVFSFIGFKFGENWTVIEPFFKRFQYLVILAGVALIALYFYKHLRHGKKSKN